MGGTRPAERSDDEMLVWGLLPNAEELQAAMTEAIQANARTWSQQRVLWASGWASKRVGALE
jgi:hypothetical protein